MPLLWKDKFRQWRHRWSELSYGQQRMFQTLAVLAVGTVCAPLVYFAARPLINHWRHRQALAQAAQFERQEDYRNVVLALHRAVQIAPGDIDTWRWVARTLDTLGASDALVAHENIVALAPGDAQARAALAATALRLDKADTARLALRELERDPAHRESYLRLAAELARADDDWPRYEELLGALAQLRPADSEIRFNLAALELAHASAPRAEAGRAALRTLLDQPTVRVRAALALLRDAARARDAVLAGSVVHAIIERCAVGQVSSPTGDPWPLLLATLQHAAAARGEDDVARVALWMGSIRRAREALGWIDRLPEATRTARAVRDATAELAARADDAPRLQSLLADGAWGSVPVESVTSALASHADQRAHRVGAALTRWQEAVRYAEQSPTALRALARLAHLWQDDAGLETATKAALRLRPQSPWANRELRDLYFARGETAKLAAHYATWIEFEPDRPTVVFGWVRTAAALDRVNDAMDRRTQQLLASPDASSLTRLARTLVLWRRKRPAEAAEVLRSLPLGSAGLTETLVVRALVAGDSIGADEIAKLRSGELLPEERNLLKLPAAATDKGI